MAQPLAYYTEVLDFWFGPKSSPDYLQEKPFWYGSPEDDIPVRNHLGDLYQAAADGKLDQWASPEAGNGDSALALILLLDQVPRNIFRGSPRAYATDAKALAIAREVVSRGWDKPMPSIQRRYIYSPFNHSEDLKDQEESVRLFTEMGVEEHLPVVRNYYEQIKQYGRFKHRDSILGR